MNVVLAQSASAPRSTDDLEQHLGKGYDALRQEQYELAVQEFRAALQIDPKLTLRARFPLAVALFELHKPDEARREFETVDRDVPDHPNVQYYLGRMDIDAGKLPSAIANLLKAAQKPPFPDTAYYLGYAYFQQGDLPNAEKWLKEAVEANPQDSRMEYQLAQVYRQEGRDEEAKKALARTKELQHQTASQSQLRRDCLLKLEQGSREEAHAVCDQLYDPDDAANLTALGTMYAQHGDLQAALKPLARAAELEPQSPQMQYNLALTYYQLHDFQKARAPLESSVKRWPDLFQLSALYGAVLFELQDDVAAYEELRHAHQLNATDTGTGDLFYLATLRLARKNQSEQHYSDAVRYFEEAAKLKAVEPAPHYGLVEVYKLMGRSALAAAEQKRGEELEKKAGR
jgi:tetratricopeptide (TPR) repeat protein